MERMYGQVESVEKRNWEEDFVFGITYVDDKLSLLKSSKGFLNTWRRRNLKKKKTFKTIGK